jgi:23S rRNA pseudouridine2605 synthase
MSAKANAGVRLQKFLSDAGVASRREAEEIILEGRVSVNGRMVDSLPAFVEPATDEVRVDGARVHVAAHQYWLVHKPKNVLCTNSDPAGRVRACDLLPPQAGRLFPVGRLDADSTGLLLMTNDGELAQRVTHPRFGVPKTYRVEVRGRVPADVGARMTRGVYLAEGRAAATEVEVTHRSDERSVLLVTLCEGRNRIIRRMLARLGFAVRTLKRVQIGPLSLRNLPVGAARQLSDQELELLRRAIKAERTRARRAPTRRPGGAVRPAVGGVAAAGEEIGRAHV